MPITATNPVVVPAQGEKTYDKFWISSLSIDGNNPTLPVKIVVVLKRATQLPDTSFEFMPDSAPVVITVDDVYATAAVNSDLATALNAVLNAVHSIGVAEGLI